MLTRQQICLGVPGLRMQAEVDYAWHMTGTPNQSDNLHVLLYTQTLCNFIRQDAV